MTTCLLPGADCGEQRDACVDEPCEFSSCTDLLPDDPLVEQGLQFTCGECDAGYQKIGGLINSSCEGTTCVDCVTSYLNLAQVVLLFLFKRLLHVLNTCILMALKKSA